MTEIPHRQIEAWVDTLISARAAGCVREVHGCRYPDPHWDGQMDAREARFGRNHSYQAKTLGAALQRRSTLERARLAAKGYR